MRTLPIAVVFVVTFEALMAVPETRPSEKIPFRLYRNYMILVEGRIGPLDGLTFLIDTGASAPVLSTHTARRLGLKTRSRKAVAYGREIETKSAIIRDLHLGRTQLGPVPVLIANVASLLPQIGNRIDAIIGMNSLIRVPFRIDFEARMMTLRPPDSLPASSPIEVQAGLPVITVLLEGEPVRLLLDTGAEQLIVFGERQKSAKKQKVLGSKTLYHIGVQDELKWVRYAELTIGSYRRVQVDAYRLDTPIRHLPEMEGIVGVASLGFSSVQFDWDQELMSWIPEDDRRHRRSSGPQTTLP
jgi:hypothetical protein